MYLEKCKKFKDNGKTRCVMNHDDPSESIFNLYASALSTNDARSNQWIVDSGATQHMCNNRDYFYKYEELLNPISIEIGDGNFLKAVAVGSVSIKHNLPDDLIKDCNLDNVYHVPKLAYNLISVSQVAQKGRITSFYKSHCEIRDTDEVLAIGNKIGKLYVLNCFQDIAGMCSGNFPDEMVWHRRFCHLGMSNVRKLIDKD